MEKSLTISKKSLPLTSMQYESLRVLGLKHIQELSGKLWTDYNTHDPGVTMLEVLSYVLTDLGYRVNYKIQDILAQDPEAAGAPELKNFYTAGQILPSAPVTLNDFRKLMMDVEVVDDSGDEPAYAGVKNAWIQMATDAEQKIYVDQKKSLLSLDEVSGLTTQDSFYVKNLYDVLLEFDETDELGDLNANTIESELVIYSHAPEPGIEGLTFSIKIEFPHWEDYSVNWSDPVSVQANIGVVTVKVYDLPERYTLEAIVSNKNEIILKGTKETGGTVSNIDGLNALMDQLKDSMFGTDGMLQLYLKKVEKIHQIVDAVKATLHANRSLCDDFFRFNALKVEEILLCADIELEQAADVEEVEARIFKNIGDFLSPQVNFHTLDEMLDKCNDAPRYEISNIITTKKVFTVTGKPVEDFNKDDTITVIGSGKNDGEYTLCCIRENRDDPAFTDLEVSESIDSTDFDEGAYLIRGSTGDADCLSVDRIFEGPKLKHGFIDDEELKAAARRKVIRVSDLIRIIMDVEGVHAVRSIQIANRPQDNNENIESKSVKWCLELHMEENYVPRLHIDDSKLTHYKDQLPFLANRTEVKTLIEELKSGDRPQKLRYPLMDISVPWGNFRDIEKYTSLQEDFPLLYGIGSEGIPGLNSLTGSDKTGRQTEVNQLKAFLLFFDQLLANYLSQLAHTKELFSMNGEKDKFGNYLIDRTYFTQALDTVIPDAGPLFADKAGYPAALQQIAEDKPLYEKRRNKFLDHLLGRFAETFTDYAMLSFKVSGSKAAAELIEDKLRFLNAYPSLSHNRGKAFNYLHPCRVWHVDNVPGLEKRVSLLAGIEERSPLVLRFGKNFTIVSPATAGSTFGLQISDDSANVMFEAGGFVSDDDARAATEAIIVVGLSKENFRIVESDGTFLIELRCDSGLTATSHRTDFTSDAPGGDADQLIDETIRVLEREFFSNPEANRKNLACPLQNYFKVKLLANMGANPPTCTITYSLYAEAFTFTTERELLTGSLTIEAKAGDPEAEVLKKGQEQVYKVLWDVINNGMAEGHYFFIPETAPYTSPYLFVIRDRHGLEIARSIAHDFNDLLATEIGSLVSAKILVSGSTANDGEYTVSTATADGPFVKISVSPAPTPPVFDGRLSWTESFAIIAIDPQAHCIEVSRDLSRVLAAGASVSIEGSDSNDGSYTILKLEVTGGITRVFVKETIPAGEPSGKLVYTKIFEITGLDGTSFTIRGLADRQAVSEMKTFIEKTFFKHEGMHVLEHVLLRPRINEPLFLEMTGTVLQEGLAGEGELYFQKTVPVLSTDSANSTVTVAGDIAGQLTGSLFSIGGGSLNDGDYLLFLKTFDGTNTVLTTDTQQSSILYDLPDGSQPAGQVIFTKKTTVNGISASAKQIVVSDTDALALSAGDVIEIKGSSNNANNFRFSVLTVAQNGSDIEISVDKVEQIVQDALLPINLDQDCQSCQIKDPYSFVATVVLPYWPCRFINMDFRKFMERTLRKEAPAHVLLSICWIDCRQMSEFELKYKAWLLESGKPEPDKAVLSEKLSELIGILTKIRNVYPTGTLHDCEEDENLEGAIILNNSVLGTF